MSYEGTLRGREYIKGSYKDMKIYSILRREYDQAPAKQQTIAARPLGSIGHLQGSQWGGPHCKPVSSSARQHFVLVLAEMPKCANMQRS